MAGSRWRSSELRLRRAVRGRAHCVSFLILHLNRRCDILSPVNRANTYSPASPTPGESASARDAILRITPLLARGKNLEIRVPGSKESVALPALSVRLLMNLLSKMAEGIAVALVPVRAELTTRQAAELLGVSRPFFVEQLETGRLPFHKVGTHRRVNIEDVTKLKSLIAQFGMVSDTTVRAEIRTRKSSTAKRLRALGIDALGRTSPRAHVWTPAQNALLGTSSDAEIGRMIGLSASSVSLRRHMLGIPAHKPVRASSRIRYLNADPLHRPSFLGERS
jgi:excisionase family DNA binding protein